MTVTAAQAFEAVSNALSACEVEKSSLPASTVARRLGFVEQGHPDRHVIVNYVFIDPLGDSVSLSERWYDPSGPFQNLPDIHRVKLALASKGRVVQELMAEYER